MSDTPAATPTPKSNPFKNTITLTVRLGTAPEAQFTGEGRLWAKARAVMNQGKDHNQQEKPPLWMTVKVFTTKEGNTQAVDTFNDLKKGDLVTVTGRLAYEEWPTQDGGKGSSVVILAYKVEPLEARQPAAPATTAEPVEADIPF
jgi:single-stranded DNA-binding protein